MKTGCLKLYQDFPWYPCNQWLLWILPDSCIQNKKYGSIAPKIIIPFKPEVSSSYSKNPPLLLQLPISSPMAVSSTTPILPVKSNNKTSTLSQQTKILKFIFCSNTINLAIFAKSFGKYCQGIGSCSMQWPWSNSRVIDHNLGNINFPELHIHDNNAQEGKYINKNPIIKWNCFGWVIDHIKQQNLGKSPSITIGEWDIDIRIRRLFLRHSSFAVSTYWLWDGE